MEWFWYILAALAGALAGSLTELLSASELDTVTVPAAISAVLLVLSFLV